MKANEAPEKLYVNFHFIETHPESHQPLVTKQGINKYDIEYTRTDAFIEKACQFIEKHHHEFSFWNTEEYELEFSTQKFIEDFKKHMEGE